MLTKVVEGNACAPVPTLPTDVVEGMRQAAQMDPAGQSSNDPIAGTDLSIRTTSGAAVCESSPHHGAEECCKTRGTGDILGMGRSIVGRDVHAAFLAMTRLRAQLSVSFRKTFCKTRVTPAVIPQPGQTYQLA